jgi:hypothetical protein
VLRAQQQLVAPVLLYLELLFPTENDSVCIRAGRRQGFLSTPSSVVVFPIGSDGDSVWGKGGARREGGREGERASGGGGREGEGQGE